MTSLRDVKSWCIESGFHPNKVLGQNFLIDRNVLVAIVDAGFAGREAKGLRVLEIGPGLGVLTEEMLSRGALVTAIEKDHDLASRLAASLGGPQGLKVVEADALDWIGAGGGAGAFDSMVSNLPYQAGTRILMELVGRREIPSMTVLLQSEVAERLAAKEGSKTRSLAGVWAQLDYDVRIVRRVSAGCFWPRPAVGSAVAVLTRHDRNAALSEEVRREFRRITKQAFEHRRKQLGTVFRGIVESTARAEELSNGEWTALAADLSARPRNMV